MKLAIIGSRNFTDNDLMDQHLKGLCIDEIISGGAKGADTLARNYAIENQIPLKEFKPDWAQYGRGAGIIRNKKIIDSADYILAFWDGQSKGTQHSINYAKKNDKPIKVIPFHTLPVLR